LRAAVIDLPPPGVSVLDRPIAVHRRGDAGAARRVLVVGAVHGDEPGGRAVTRALLRADPPRGTAYYVVHDLNPDGARRGRRQNARGVDLNRNFPHRWRRAARGRFWPGPSAGSEPETRYAMRVVRALRPDVTVWLHQPYGIVVPAAGASGRLVRRYARVARLPVRRLPRYRGTAAGWQNALLRNGGAFVVELAAGTPGAATVRRHVRAIRAVASPPARTLAAQAPRRPAVRWTPIPYGTGRKRQMRRYARRHSGVDSHLLRDPKVIVEHFTASNSFSSAFARSPPTPRTSARSPACARTSSSTATARSTSCSPCGSCAATRSASTTPRSASSTSGRATPRSWATAASSPPRCA
jgi:protein MpaA